MQWNGPGVQRDRPAMQWIHPRAATKLFGCAVEWVGDAAESFRCAVEPSGGAVESFHYAEEPSSGVVESFHCTGKSFRCGVLEGRRAALPRERPAEGLWDTPTASPPHHPRQPLLQARLRLVGLNRQDPLAGLSVQNNEVLTSMATFLLPLCNMATNPLALKTLGQLPPFCS